MIADYGADTIGPHYSETYAGILLTRRSCFDKICWTTAFRPAFAVRIPDARFAVTPFRKENVQKAVVIQIEQPDAVVRSVRSAQGMPGKQILIQALLRFAEIEKLYSIAVFLNRVIN